MKVGDKVRVISFLNRNDARRYKYLIGRVGEVVEIRKGFGFPVAVRLEHTRSPNPDGLDYFMHEELQCE